MAANLRPLLTAFCVLISQPGAYACLAMQSASSASLVATVPATRGTRTCLLSPVADQAPGIATTLSPTVSPSSLSTTTNNTISYQCTVPTGSTGCSVTVKVTNFAGTTPITICTGMTCSLTLTCTGFGFFSVNPAGTTITLLIGSIKCTLTNDGTNTCTGAPTG